MHILHVAASLNPNSAAGRLCTALRHEGCQISTLGAFPPAFDAGHYFSKATWHAKWRTRFGKIPVWLCPHRQKNMPWSTPLFGNNLKLWVDQIQPDIVHMHWIAASTLNLNRLNDIKVPLVWTFHDTWPVTAGCHCCMECEKWRTECCNCPQLGPGIAGVDFANIFWRYKRRAYAQIHVEAISPSGWLADMARRSPLWMGKKVHHLGNALDIDVFAPADKHAMRRLWGIPEGKPVILFGATVTSIPYKGLDLLLQALQHLKSQNINAQIVIFGESSVASEVHFPVTSVGFVHDPVKLATLYATADVFVAPSRQDNLPTTVLEASACGVPCVTFDVGGISDIVIHNESGYLAKKFDTEDLARGIRLVLDSSEKARSWGARARTHVMKRYASGAIARQHIALYKQILQRG